MSGRLSGRVAFVTLEEPTGGRSESLARALVGVGALVVLVSTDAEAGGRMAEAVGAEAVFCPSDDVDADTRALVELAEDLTGSGAPGS